MSGGGVRAVRAVLAAFPEGQAALAAGVRIERLPGGIANRSFKVASQAGNLVVRLGGGQDARLGIDRVAERQVLEVVAPQGFAPPVLHVEPARGVLVTAHVAAGAWTRAMARSSGDIVRLAERLRELHALPLPQTVRRLDVCEAIACYLEMPEATRVPVKREPLTALLRWALAGYRPRFAALCHHDLHHRNVIEAGPLVFVDWEYGGVGDPLMDLAAVACYHDYDDAQRAALLDAYGGGIAARPFADACIVFDCLTALWLDVAGGWRSLERARRAALVRRLEFDPPMRRPR